MANITINLNLGGKTKTRSIADPPPPIPDVILKRGFADAHPFRDRKLKPKKKKQCTKGHQCGFSCVSPTKICLADMTTAQLKAHNAAKRAERSAASMKEYKEIADKYGKLTREENDAAKSHFDGFNSLLSQERTDDAMKKYWQTRREFGYAEEQVKRWEKTDLADNYNKSVYETGMRRARIFGTATMAIEEKLIKEGKTKDELDSIYNKIDNPNVLLSANPED